MPTVLQRTDYERYNGSRLADETDWFVYKPLTCNECYSTFTIELDEKVFVSGRNSIFPSCPVCHNRDFYFHKWWHRVFLRY